MTTTVPDEVPYILPTDGASNDEWYYWGNTLYHNHSSTDYSHLPNLHHFEVGHKVGLLLLPNGELHLFLDEKKAAKVATGLPVHKSLFGAVDVCGICTKIKSEILSGELDGQVCIYIHVCIAYHHNTDGIKWALHTHTPLSQIAIMLLRTHTCI